MDKPDLSSLNASFLSFSAVVTITTEHADTLKEAIGKDSKIGYNEWQSCRNYKSETEIQHHVKLLLAKYPGETNQYYVEFTFLPGTPSWGLKTSLKYEPAFKELKKIPNTLSFFVNTEFIYSRSYPTIYNLPIQLGTSDFTEIRGLTIVKLAEDNKTFSHSLKVEIISEEQMRCLVTFRNDTTFSTLSITQLLKQSYDLSKKYFLITEEQDGR
jgi:hypothetical protein